MDRLIEYTIPFKGLKEGIHEYEFHVDNKFFEEFENSEIESADTLVKLEFIKRSSFMQLKFYISGTVSVTCDRCLDDYEQFVEKEFSMLIKFSDEPSDENEEIIYLPLTAHSVNVAQYVYEYIALSIPLHRIHPDDENGNPSCNSEMLDKLNEHLIGDDTDEKEEEPIDSRWSELKKLLDN